MKKLSQELPNHKVKGGATYCLGYENQDLPFVGVTSSKGSWGLKKEYINGDSSLDLDIYGEND